jgi:Fic family protein
VFEHIDNLKKNIDNKRPLDAEMMKTVAQKFRESWTYHSNAIEGNTLTLQETTFYLRGRAH